MAYNPTVPGTVLHGNKDRYQSLGTQSVPGKCHVWNNFFVLLGIGVYREQGKNLGSPLSVGMSLLTRLHIYMTWKYIP